MSMFCLPQLSTMIRSKEVDDYHMLTGQKDDYEKLSGTPKLICLGDTTF